MPDQPDPPDKWRVYESDDTPDPEPSTTPPPPPPVSTPNVPYGQQASYNPVVITSSSSSGVAPKLILLVVALAVVGGVVAGAIAIFSAVGGVDGITGVDPKKPGDFSKMVDAVEKKTGNTEVFSVGLYDGYAVIYVPVKATGDSAIAYDWRGGDDLDVFTKTTATDQRFSLDEIDPDVIGGMCDPVLQLAEGATPGDCYVFIRKPDPEYGKGAWFTASASDEYGHYYSVTYDINGKEVDRTVPDD